MCTLCTQESFTFTGESLEGKKGISRTLVLIDKRVYDSGTKQRLNLGR